MTPDVAGLTAGRAEDSAPSSEGVVAVIVTYHPQPAKLEALLFALRAQVQRIVIVDNGSADVGAATRALPGIDTVLLGSNLGIAAAQNRGVESARDLGAKFVVFFDQDSLPPPDLIERLRAAYRTLGDGAAVAAVGPMPLDRRLGRRAYPGLPASGTVAVDHLIASGCLISLAAFDRVGPLRAELFIDYVDTEWCLRAASLGLRCYCVPDIVLEHEFGTPVRILGRTIAGSTATRHYYLVRNSIWLWTRPWVPTGWKVVKGIRLLARLGIAAVVARPHRHHWRMMARGFRDGIAGRLGALHDPN